MRKDCRKCKTGNIGCEKDSSKKWDDSCMSKEKLLFELAKEEIIENGVWMSYCRDNALRVNL